MNKSKHYNIMLFIILPLIFDFLKKPIELLKSCKTIYNTKYPISVEIDGPQLFIINKYRCRYIRFHNKGILSSYKEIKHDFKLVFNNDLAKCPGFSSVTSLELLIKSGYFIDPITFSYLTNLKKLTILTYYCYDNIYNSFFFRYLSNLTYLHLDTNLNITDPNLKDLPNIKYLFAYRDVITNDGLKYISEIDTLILPNNEITITNKGLTNLKNIKVLNLRYNKLVNDEGFKLIPDCKITHNFYRSPQYNNISYNERLKLLEKLQKMNDELIVLFDDWLDIPE